MGVLIVAVVATVIAIGAVMAVVRRRGRAATPPSAAQAAETTVPRAPRPDPAPMTGLEDALNRVTDRSGTSMADRLDAESDAVEGLRVTDDTGPLLRRALDRFDQAGVEHDDPGVADASMTDEAGRSET